MKTYLIQFKQSKAGKTKRAIVDTVDPINIAIEEAKERYKAKSIIGCQEILQSVRHLYVSGACTVLR